MPVFVALDAGTGGGKCAVFDAAGQVLATHREPWSYTVARDPAMPFVRSFAFDPDAFWAAMCRCVRAAVEAARIDQSNVAGIATTSQREGCVFLDAGGREIYAGPNLDARGFVEGLDVLGALGGERLYAITGHSAPFIFPIARYLWFRKHDPRPVAHVLMINDWLTYRLCGALAAEPSNATESMLFDLRERRWSAEILERFEIPRSILPEVVNPGMRVGELTRTAAEQCGLLTGTPVLMGGADTQCSLLGAGAIEAGDTAATLGTTTPVQMVTAAPEFDPAGNLWAGCHVVPDRWVLESNVGDTGDAYNWLLELVAGDREPAARYALAEQWAVQSPEIGALAYVGPSVFDLTKMRPNKPGGLLFPFPTMHLRPDRAALVRAFLESIGYAIRANLEQLQALIGQTPSALILSGGMARSRALLSLIRDITGIPVRIATEPESAPLGCAVLIALGTGVYPDLRAATAAMLGHRDEEPDPANVATFAEGYAKWRELYGALENLNI
ncbi:MAG TPA: FGGY-family carbohydrate kinase [Candidatus Binatia bacterium]|nr:FGGY-family carbohydrate kinase [Candidatus Binatia bacterium]